MPQTNQNPLAWFDLQIKGDQATIKFDFSKHRYWSPLVIREHPIPFEELRGRKITVTGGGSGWMYAYAAANLEAIGAEGIEFATRFVGTSNDREGSECRLEQAMNDRTKALITITLAQTEEGLADDEIRKMIDEKLPLGSDLDIKELCITGLASLKAYGWIAQRAVTIGVQRISCITPVVNMVTVYGLEESGETTEENSLSRLDWPEWLMQLVPKPKEPIVIGVIGDPNLGKSNFSSSLHHHRENIVKTSGWRFDCDGQAPTQNWYRKLLKQDTNEAHEAREAIKRPWTNEMQKEIGLCLQRLRDHFEVIIADLPGGNHKAIPVRRLPEGREQIFREIDVLILLYGHDDQIDAWREALRPHGLERRIAAFLRSSAPENKPSLIGQFKGDFWYGEVQGLDRNTKVEAMSRAFEKAFRELWPAIVRFGKKQSFTETNE